MSGDIYAAMVAVQRDLVAIGKDTESPYLNYTFRSADDVIDMLHPLFVKHGITCAPVVLDQAQSEIQTTNGKRMMHVLLRMQFTYHAIDGSSIEVITVGEAADTSDKSCNKAMTAARKAADCQVFTIPTGDTDPEYTRPDIGTGNDQEQVPRTQKKADKRKATPKKNAAPKRKAAAKPKAGAKQAGPDAATESQLKLLGARSLARSRDLIERQIQENLPMGFADETELRLAISVLACETCGVVSSPMKWDVDGLLSTIERCTIDQAGNLRLAE